VGSAWEYQAGAAIGSSPVVVGGYAIVVSAEGTVHAVSLQTGVAAWTANLGAEVGSATPLIIGGLAVIGDEAGVVHALDPATGTERWRTTIDGPIPGALASTSGLVVAATRTGSAVALKPANGEVVWRSTLRAGVTRSIAATDDAAYLALDGGWFVALRSADGAQLWEARVATDGSGGTPTVAGGLVYAAAGLDMEGVTPALVALDRLTGKERWRYASPQAAAVYAPAVADGRAFAIAEDGTVVALDTSSGETLWTLNTGAPNDAPPSLVGAILYVGDTNGSLIAFNAADGAELWRVAIVGVPYPAVVTHGLVFLGTNAGVLYALGRFVP
jgi:outer membrane protein assembly factor BamB